MTPLAREWVAWITENVLRGAPRPDLIAGLVAGGLDEARAAAEVDAVVGSPILLGARHLLERSAAIEQAARLRRELDREPIRELGSLDDETLFRDHWTVNRPVVLRGAAKDWPAASWTPRRLADRFGDVEVDVLAGRSADPRWWRDPRPTMTRRIRFAELMALTEGPPGDDVYADGRTDLLSRPGLEVLKGELGLLPGLVGDGFPKAWIGPAGTLTPTHHDQSTGWLVQLHGQKRVRMASPLEPALASHTDGLYNLVDPRQPQAGELAEVRWHTIELGPGDALLINVGWWHHVEALTPSISVSMGGFRWPNVFSWYCPGRR